MRLAIAAGILANTLPVASQKQDITLQLADRFIQSHSAEIVEGREIKPRHLFSHGVAAAGDVASVMKNEVVKEERIECNPGSSDADVGILSCGMGSYCMVSEDSDLGGICVATEVTRELQEHYQPGFQSPDTCNASSPYYNVLPCDCSTFDQQTYVGDIICDYKMNICIDPPANTTCYDANVSAYFYAPDNYANIHCYGFLSPYTQQVCYGVTNAGGCWIKVDGVDCNSCSFEAFDPMYPFFGCYEFDCTNTPPMTSGNTCDGAKAAALFAQPGLPSPTDPHAPQPTMVAPEPTSPPVEEPTMTVPEPTMTGPEPTMPPAADPTDAPEPDASPNLLAQQSVMSMIGVSLGMLLYLAA